jgi:exosortase A
VKGSRISAALSGADGRMWLRDAAVLLIAIVVLAAIFWREASGAVAVWIQSPTFNHGFLILPIALYMMWTRHDGVAALPHRPAAWAALLILPLSFLWLITAIASILEAQQFVVVAILQVMLVASLGWPVYRRFAAPFLYLFFLVPSGAELVPALQQVTAHFAVIALKLIGVPVYSNGAVIEIPAGTFAVAEACAGLRFLVATVAFGVFYAAQIYRGIAKRLVFIALCVVVPIVANGLRVFGIIWAAQLLGSPTAAVADHLIYGWVFFSLVLVLLVFAGRPFADDDTPAEAEGSAAAHGATPSMASIFGAGALAAVAAAVFPAVWFLLGESSAAAFPAAPPAVSRPWQRTADDSGWTPVLVDPARIFAAAHADGDSKVYSYIALYPARGRTNNLVRSNNRLASEKDWKLNSNRFETLDIGGRTIPVAVTTISGSVRKLTVWSFYVVGGSPEASVWSVKLRQLRDYFSSGNCASAFVAVAAESTGSQAADDREAARYLSAMPPLDEYLCGSNAH